jgi:O-antigen/teichoic acid export membrane protein
MATFGQRLAFSVGLVLAGRAIGLALNAVTFLWIARGLGPERFGLYTLAFVYVSFFATVIDNGLNIVVTRAIAREPDDAGRLVGNALVLKTLLCLPLMGLAVVLAHAPWAPPGLRDLVAVASGLILVTGLSAVNALFQARAQMAWVVGGDLVARALFLIGAPMVIRAGGSLETLFAVQVASMAAGLLLPLGRALVELAPRLRIDPSVWRGLVGPAAALSASLALGMLTARFDMMVLPAVASPRAVGQYAAAFRLVDLLLLLPALMLQVVFPAFVARAGAVDALEARFRRVERVLALLGLPAAVFLTMAAGPVLVVTGGAAYAGGASSLALLAWGMMAVYLSNGMLYVLVATGRSQALLGWSAAGAAASVLLGLVLAPRFGPIGAAAATVTAHTIVLLGLSSVLWRSLRVRPWPDGLPDIALATGVVAAVTAVLLPRIPVVAVAAASAITLAATLAALPGPRRELAALLRRDPEPTPVS